MVNVVLSADLIAAAAEISKNHPDASLQIEWREGSPEHLWIITVFEDSNTSVMYLVEDDSGVHAPTSDEELLSMGVTVA